MQDTSGDILQYDNMTTTLSNQEAATATLPKFRPGNSDANSESKTSATRRSTPYHTRKKEREFVTACERQNSFA
jgi:hypothetical protein